MKNYAAYLRVYEPVSAFHEPDRSRWTAYAASATRPRRRDTLAAEQLAVLRLLVGGDRPAGEHAYVRFADGMVYICPWQVKERTQPSVADARCHIQTSGWTVPLAGPLARAVSPALTGRIGLRRAGPPAQ